MNSTDTPNAAHPGSLLLDQLRAGLLDHQPDTKTRLLEHLRGCPYCRQQAVAMDGLVASQRLGPDPRLAHQLRARRMAALTGATPRQPTPRRLAPAFALAVVVAVSVGVGGFLELKPAQAPQPLAQTGSDNVPDLYADIDFYLWLSNHPVTENADADRS